MAYRPGRFFYLVCPVCEWDTVIAAVEPGLVGAARQTAPTCPLCASDNGRDIRLSSRAAEDSDVVEGFDARAHV